MTRSSAMLASFGSVKTTLGSTNPRVASPDLTIFEASVPLKRHQELPAEYSGRGRATTNHLVVTPLRVRRRPLRDRSMGCARAPRLDARRNSMAHRPPGRADIYRLLGVRRGDVPKLTRSAPRLTTVIGASSRRLLSPPSRSRRPPVRAPRRQ